MRTKRSKVYKKAIALYTSAFKFREPYQLLLDAEFVKTAEKQKTDLYARMADIFGGNVKLMITQCSIQHLYNGGQASQPAVELAQTFERRKCNHWEMKETDAECIQGIVGDENQYRYCVVTQSPALRNKLRKVPGVPLVFEKRGMILMEPPSDASVGRRKEIEESKLHIPSSELAGLQPRASTSTSVATEAEDDAPASGVTATSQLPIATRSTAASEPLTAEQMLAKKRGKKKVGGPNPLSVKKKKRDPAGAKKAGGEKAKTQDVKGKGKERSGDGNTSKPEGAANGSATGAKKKRTRDEAFPADSEKAPSNGKAHTDPTAGVSRPEGPGTSKKALKRKKKKLERKAEGKENSGAAKSIEA